jgi:hypothetical protein
MYQQQGLESPQQSVILACQLAVEKRTSTVMFPGQARSRAMLHHAMPIHASGQVIFVADLNPCFVDRSMHVDRDNTLP